MSGQLNAMIPARTNRHATPIRGFRNFPMAKRLSLVVPRSLIVTAVALEVTAVFDFARGVSWQPFSDRRR